MLAATCLVLSLQVVSLQQEIDSAHSVYHKEIAEHQAGFRGDQCSNRFLQNQKGEIKIHLYNFAKRPMRSSSLKQVMPN